jgi:hypothetical protein
MHTMVILIFSVAAILVVLGLKKAAKNQQSVRVEFIDPEVLSHARAAAALRAAREERRHTRANCVVASTGRAISVDVLAVNIDGTLRLRRRGHPHSAPFDRPAGAMFSR